MASRRRGGTGSGGKATAAEREAALLRMNDEIERQTAALVLEADTVLQDHAHGLLANPEPKTDGGSFEGDELFSGPEDGHDSDVVRPNRVD